MRRCGLRKRAAESGKIFPPASRHEGILADLQPDILIIKDEDRDPAKREEVKRHAL